MFLISRLGALISCSLFPIIFVGSLYIWKQDSKLDRNHPKVIKQRFISVLITCILSTIYLYLFWESKNVNYLLKKILIFNLLKNRIQM